MDTELRVITLCYNKECKTIFFCLSVCIFYIFIFVVKCRVLFSCTTFLEGKWHFVVSLYYTGEKTIETTMKMYFTLILISEVEWKLVGWYIKINLIMQSNGIHIYYTEIYRFELFLRVEEETCRLQDNWRIVINGVPRREWEKDNMLVKL